MAFVRYDPPYKGRRAQAISREKALDLQYALKHPESVSDLEKLDYMKHVRQLAIPPLTEPVRLSDVPLKAQQLTEAEQQPLAYKDSD